MSSLFARKARTWADSDRIWFYATRRKPVSDGQYEEGYLRTYYSTSCACGEGVRNGGAGAAAGFVDALLPEARSTGHAVSLSRKVWRRFACCHVDG